MRAARPWRNPIALSPSIGREGKGSEGRAAWQTVPRHQHGLVGDPEAANFADQVERAGDADQVGGTGGFNCHSDGIGRGWLNGDFDAETGCSAGQTRWIEP